MTALLVYCFEHPVEYTLAWQGQKNLVAARKADTSLPDVLLLLEHPPVYTLGQGGASQYLRETSCYTRVERGGEVTYHAPGQLVGYPILNLQRYQPDLHWYLRQLEEVLIQTLLKVGVKGSRRSGLTGVWIADQKVAQIGIKVSRWITMHGFSLNVSMDLAGFDPIVPCGINGCRCTNLNQYLSSPTTVPEIRSIVVETFAEVFEIPGEKMIHKLAVNPEQFPA